MTYLVCPIEPHELDKKMRRGFDDLVRRVTASSAAHGLGNDLLLRVYLAGIYHGVEAMNRQALASAGEAFGGDGETRLHAKHEHATGVAGDAQQSSATHPKVTHD